MIIQHKGNLDFTCRENRYNFHVVQGDCGSRILELTLLESGKP